MNYVLTNFPYMSPKNIKDFFDLKQDVKQIKNKKYHLSQKYDIPKSLKDLVDKHYGLLLYYSKEFVIMGQKWSIDLLCESVIITMDGTFKAVVDDFKQLYTLHGVYNGRFLPSLFCFLHNKQHASYESLFDELESIANKQNKTMFHRKVFIVTDFEISVINYFKKIESVTEVGCIFHHKKNVFKKARKLGLKSFISIGKKIYFENDENKFGKKEYKLYQNIIRITNIPFLPMELQQASVVDAIIDDMMDTDDDLDDDYKKKLSSLGQYYKSTWIGIKSKYKCHLFGLSIVTNNDCEGYHSCINRDLPGNPSLYHVLDKIHHQIIRSRNFIKSNDVKKESNLVVMKRQLLSQIGKELIENVIDVITFLDDVQMIINANTNDIDNVIISLGSLERYENVSVWKSYLNEYGFIEQNLSKYNEFVQSEEYYPMLSNIISKVTLTENGNDVKEIIEISSVDKSSIFRKDFQDRNEQNFEINSLESDQTILLEENEENGLTKEKDTKKSKSITYRSIPRNSSIFLGKLTRKKIQIIDEEGNVMKMKKEERKEKNEGEEWKGLEDHSAEIREIIEELRNEKKERRMFENDAKEERELFRKEREEFLKEKEELRKEKEELRKEKDEFMKKK